jgi:hypothetical protein
VTQILELSADEVLALHDRVAVSDTGTDEQRVHPRLLLLKLMSAYVDMFGAGDKPSGTIPIAVTEPEAWVLWSKINSMDKTASDALFGVKLLLKINRAILAYNTACALPVSAEPGVEMDVAHKEALAAWKEREAPNGTSPGTNDPGDCPADGADPKAPAG